MSLWATAIAAVWLAQEPGLGASLGHEWVGAELAALSLNAGSTSFGGAPDRFQPGFGATVRLLRRTWARTYWIPVMSGLFLARTHYSQHGNLWTVLAHVQTEGGVRLSTTAGTFELGLAAGAGIVSIPYVDGCNESCVLGAKGALLSPVVRYMLRERPNSSVGISLRAVLPVTEPEGNLFGYYGGRATLFLLALDLAIGPAP